MGERDPGIGRRSNPGLPHPPTSEAAPVLADGPRAERKQLMRTITSSVDCRCKNCQALLAKNDRDGITIRRGDMQATVTGADFTFAVTCYRCQTLNVLAQPRKPAPALPRTPTA